MTSERLRELLTARPFQRFIIHLADGRVPRVDHPEMVALAPSGRTAAVFHRDDSCNFIDVMLVTDLETHVNGGKKNRKNH